MSKPGTVGWIDITVKNADELMDFYSKVVGWRASPVSMGDYNDYSMVAPDDDTTVCGICHRLGVNKGIPSQWIIYVYVEDLDLSMLSCRELGGKVIHGPKSMGADRYCIIRDPSGAHIGLYEKK